MFPKLDPLLHSELRLAVMSILAGVDEADFTYLKRQTGATSGNLSVQIDKLTTAGYITMEKGFKGKMQLYFWYFVQYILDQQMRAAHDYARQHRVILKGDIPIGISRDGVEAWVEPKYFNLNGQAGAPHLGNPRA